MLSERDTRKGGVIVNDLTNDLLTALVGATPDCKEAALRVLRGEAEAVEPEPMPAPAKPETEPYLTQQECARRLGLSACSLWRWQVPGHELGGRPRFRISEIEAYLGSEAFRQRVAELRILDRERRLRNAEKRKAKRGNLKICEFEEKTSNER